MSCAFSRQFEGNGAEMNAIAKFNEYCASNESKEFYSCMYKLQLSADLEWNTTADCVILSFNMGFIRIREDSAACAVSIVLDMLLKFGL